MKQTGLAVIIVGTLAAVACASSEEEGPDKGLADFDAADATDETKSTHLWLVNRAVDILAKHTDLPNAANTLAWMKDAQCRVNWQNALLETDFLAPYMGGATDLKVPGGPKTSEENMLQANVEIAASRATWMSHFYDPDTGKNYLGFVKSSDLPTDQKEELLHGYASIKKVVEGPTGKAVPIEAKGAALYRAARAQDLLAGKNVDRDHKNQPEDKRARGCYELGNALHYITDISQPMHSANFAATDAPRLLHSHWEGYAQTIQGKNVRADWTTPPKSKDLAAVIQADSVAAKVQWTGSDGKPGALKKAILDAFLEGGTFDEKGALEDDSECHGPQAELKALEAARNDFFVQLAAKVVGTTPIEPTVSVDIAKCWQKNPAVVKATGVALGHAQESTARFLATIVLPKHD